MNINIYDKLNVHKLNWESKKDGILTKNYFLPLILNGASNYIQNVNTELQVLEVDDIVLPITVNVKEYSNSYVCSPYTHYISYLKEELKFLKSPILENIFKPVIDILGFFNKVSNINKVIHVNNWLLSTNLHSELSQEQIKNITKYLNQLYPEHAIIFRSINDFKNDLPIKMKLEGYKLVPSRQIYIISSDEITLKGKAKKKISKELRFIDKLGYQVVENKDGFTDIEIHRIVELYNMLYLDKYSTLNPMYTFDFFKNAVENNLLQLLALKKDNIINGVIGIFIKDNVMTTPLLGYDLNLSRQEEPLYRMLYALIVDRGQKLQLTLNQSSGAAQFKRERGANPYIEYNAIYDKHLKMKTRLLWSLWMSILNKIAVPLIKKYKL